MEILLSGCSFVEGYGLDDQDTFGWKLQSLLPQIKVTNLGVGGYGSLQSLMAVKRYLDKGGKSTRRIVVYGFADFHSVRDIKNPLHQYYITTPGIFPYCDEQGCQTWEGRAAGRLRRALRIFGVLEDALDALRLMWRRELARRVTLRLVRQMSTAVSERGGKLIIAPVSLNDTSWLTDFRNAGIPVVMCDSETLHQKEYQLEDGHPNARWTEAYSECLARELAPFLTQQETSGGAASTPPQTR